MASLADGVAQLDISAPDDLTVSGPDYSSISSSTALVSPTGEEFELISTRLQDLMEEGRGETIFDLGMCSLTHFYRFMYYTNKPSPSLYRCASGRQLRRV